VAFAVAVDQDGSAFLGTGDDFRQLIGVVVEFERILLLGKLVLEGEGDATFGILGEDVDLSLGRECLLVHVQVTALGLLAVAAHQLLITLSPCQSSNNIPIHTHSPTGNTNNTPRHQLCSRKLPLLLFTRFSRAIAFFVFSSARLTFSSICAPLSVAARLPRTIRKSF
jgi:hypothetical protein